MKKSITTFLLLFSLVAFAQGKEVSQEIIESIKSDVWMPFMESYAELDPDKLQGLHSEDIVRVYLSRNRVATGKPYLERFANFLNSSREKGNKVAIAFAISSTAVDEQGELAYQTGYYKFSSQRKGDATMMVRGYGYFTLGLRKVNGVWKIWLDTDKRVEMTPEEFNSKGTLYEL